MRRLHNTVLSLFIAIIVMMTGCSSEYPNNPYTGRDLNIGVIGGTPYVKESKKVSFSAIEFEDLIPDNRNEYDAILIKEDRLAEAANSNYSKVYSRLGLPIIFIGTNNLSPFLSAEIDFRPHGFEPGTSYAVGIIDGQQYGWGLYNDEWNEETIQLFYSELFRFIEKSLDGP